MVSKLVNVTSSVLIKISALLNSTCCLQVKDKGFDECHDLRQLHRVGEEEVLSRSGSAF